MFAYAVCVCLHLTLLGLKSLCLLVGGEKQKVRGQHIAGAIPARDTCLCLSSLHLVITHTHTHRRTYTPPHRLTLTHTHTHLHTYIQLHSKTHIFDHDHTDAYRHIDAIQVITFFFYILSCNDTILIQNHSHINAPFMRMPRSLVLPLSAL